MKTKVKRTKVKRTKKSGEKLYVCIDTGRRVKYRRLKVGEVIQKEDFANSKDNPVGTGWIETFSEGITVKDWNPCWYYRKVQDYNERNPQQPTKAPIQAEAQ